MARLTVPPGTPGMPGVADPVRTTGSVAAKPDMPLPGNAATGLPVAVAHPAGTDIEPIRPARASTALTLPRRDAAPLSAGALGSADGAAARFGRMPKFLSAWMIPAGIPSEVKMDLNAVEVP